MSIYFINNTDAENEEDPTTDETTCFKENEVYDGCGTACPLSCDVPFVDTCTEQCVEGCFCEDGYVRDYNDDCILIEECPPPAPTCELENENFTFCGTACEPTCHDPFIDFCTEQCVAGCFCEDGYVRDADGSCILLEYCLNEDS